MTTATVTETIRNGNPVGQRRELGRYTTSGDGERVLYGQRINGVVRVTDCPAAGHGRRYLIERELEQDGHAALLALVGDYLEQARVHDAIPMTAPAERWLQHAHDLELELDPESDPDQDQ